MAEINFEALLKLWKPRKTETIEKDENETEKVFEKYLYLPSELRTMIIDEMQPDDRCRFTRCSKLSNKEAKSSKNYIYSIEIGGYSKIFLLNYIYGVYTHHSIKRHGFYLRLEEMENGMKLMKCSDLQHRELWNVDLDKNTNLVNLATEHFKTMLQLYQNTIKKLVVWGPNFIFEIDNDLRIESLRSLKSIHIFNDSDIRCFTSKVKGNLERMSVENDENCRNIADLEKIYHVRDYLHMPKTKLNTHQFQKLTSSFVVIHIGDLTEVDIFNFIQSWQDGTIGRVIEQYVWRIYDSKFDVKRLQILLGAANHDFNNGPLEIESYVKDEKNGRLICNHGEVQFIGKFMPY